MKKSNRSWRRNRANFQWFQWQSANYAWVRKVKKELNKNKSKTEPEYVWRSPESEGTSNLV